MGSVLGKRFRLAAKLAGSTNSFVGPGDQCDGVVLDSDLPSCIDVWPTLSRRANLATVALSFGDPGVGDPSFVSAGDSPHLIDDLPFVLEGKRPSTAVDNQIVVTAHNARE